MSRIFALAGVTTVLAIGGVAAGVAYEGLDAPSDDAQAITEIFASGFDIAAFVPFVLIIGMVIMALGVMNQ